MRKRTLVALVALASALALGILVYRYRSSGTAAVAPAEPPAVQALTLPNGLAVELVAAECGDSVALAVAFGVGTDHDPPGQSGMVRVLERALAASVGGVATAQFESGSAHSLYSVVLPRDQVDAELVRIAARLTRLELTEAQFVAARAAVLADIEQRSGGDPELTALTYAAESIQPSPGGGRRGGVASEVEGIDRDAAVAFWAAHFKPRNARLVVLGNVDRAAATTSIEQALTPIEAGKPPSPRPPGESRVIGTLVMGETPSAVAMAVPAPPPEDERFSTFLLLAARLSSAAPGAAWTARYDPVRLPETLFVTGPVGPAEGAEPAAARIRADALRKLQSPLAPADRAAARERFGGFIGLGELQPRECAGDPRALAIARARRGQLDLAKLKLTDALDAATQDAFAAGTSFFDASRTTTVIAGGAIR